MSAPPAKPKGGEALRAVVEELRHPTEVEQRMHPDVEQGHE